MVVVGGWRRVAAGVVGWAAACGPTVVVPARAVVAESVPPPVPTFEMGVPTGPTCVRERALFELAELPPYALPASCPPGLRTAPIVADRSLCDPRGPATVRPVWLAMHAEAWRWRDGPTATRSAWVATHPGSAPADPSPQPRRGATWRDLDDLLRRASPEQPLPRNSPYGPDWSALWTDRPGSRRTSIARSWSRCCRRPASRRLCPRSRSPSSRHSRPDALPRCRRCPTPLSATACSRPALARRRGVAPRLRPIATGRCPSPRRRSVSGHRKRPYRRSRHDSASG
ncbi:MAG: hypothetical protein JWM10_4234 [Myxococcaceae bacterium]|nr:hypothetical protein [Myxococcaceae bacterium]